MKKLVFILNLLMSGAVYSQVNFFQKYYGEQFSGQQPRNVINTYDGGFLMSGTEFSGLNVGYWVKTDSAGNLEWTQKFNSGAYMYCHEVLQTEDSGFVYLGASSPTSSSGHDLVLIKTDSQGNIEWQKAGGTLETDLPDNFIQTKDKGFLILEHFLGVDEIMIMKTDSSGNTQWSKVITGLFPSHSYYGKIIETNNNNFIVTYSKAPDGFYLIKCDSAGNVLWCKDYTVSNADNCSIFSLNEVDSANNLLLCGSVNDTLNKTQMLMTKTDDEGNIIWSKQHSSLPYYDYITSVDTKSNGEFIFTAGHNYNALDSFQAVIGLADTSGNILWANSVGDLTERILFMSVTNTVSGYAALGSITYNYYYLVQTDSTGNAGCNTFPVSYTQSPLNITSTNISPSSYIDGTLYSTFMINTSSGGTEHLICNWMGIGEEELADISFYPNPFNSHFEISGTKEIGLIEIFDVTGKLISRQRSNAMRSQINVSSLTNGFYVIKYSEENSCRIFKAIKN